MNKINKTRYAILGMLFEKPLTGYDIKKIMAETTAHFWQETDASIYPMLKKLVAEGKIVPTSALRGKQKRTLYRATPAGKKEFAQWMETDIEPGTYRQELLLKIFFGANTDKTIIIKHLESRKGRLKVIQKKFAYIDLIVLPDVPEDDPHKIYQKLTLRNGIIRVEAEIKWIEESLNMLKKDKEIK